MSRPANICQVHDADDVVPGRICGRQLPCRDHDTPAGDGMRIEDLRAIRDGYEELRTHKPHSDAERVALILLAAQIPALLSTIHALRALRKAAKR